MTTAVTAAIAAPPPHGLKRMHTRHYAASATVTLRLPSNYGCESVSVGSRRHRGSGARPHALLFCSITAPAPGTELAMVADISPSTASAHLARLKLERLVRVAVQGKHRYYTLEGPDVARALESLSVLAGTPRPQFEPNTPTRLRAARTLLRPHCRKLWESPCTIDSSSLPGCSPTHTNLHSREPMRLQPSVSMSWPWREQRRRFAYPCLDWSERRPHLGGALASGILALALQRKWIEQDLEGRALHRYHPEDAARWPRTLEQPIYKAETLWLPFGSRIAQSLPSMHLPSTGDPVQFEHLRTSVRTGQWLCFHSYTRT